MNTCQANVLIHVDESLGTDQLAVLQGTLGAIEGVSAVQPSSHRHLMRVSYDPLAIRTQAIVG